MFEWTGSLQVPSCTCHTLCSVGISMGINGVTYCLCEHRISPGKKAYFKLHIRVYPCVGQIRTYDSTSLVNQLLPGRARSIPFPVPTALLKSLMSKLAATFLSSSHLSSV